MGDNRWLLIALIALIAREVRVWFMGGSWYHEPDLEAGIRSIPKVPQVIGIAGNHNRVISDCRSDHDRVNGIG
jgi:hypothetical protein